MSLTGTIAITVTQQVVGHQANLWVAAGLITEAEGRQLVDSCSLLVTLGLKIYTNQAVAAANQLADLAKRVATLEAKVH